MSIPSGIDPRIYAAALAEVRALTDRNNTGYVPPARRAGTWRSMAEDLAAAGHTLPQIADALCVTQDTVRALLGAPVGAAAA